MTELLPLGWAHCSLADVGAWGSGGTPARSNPAFFQDGTIPWLVIGDLNDGVVSSSEVAITAEGLANSSAKLLEPGTLLIAMYGSIGKLGITGIECATNQAIAFCRPKPGISLRYLFRLLQEAKPALVLKGKGGTQQNISQGVLKEHIVRLAPSAEQQRIADKLDTVLARVDACRDRLTRVAPLLKRFRQSVLAAATSGGLTVEWRRKRCSVTSSSSAQQSEDRSSAELPGGWQSAPLRDLVINMDSRRIPIRAADRAARRGSYPYYGAFGVIDSIDEYIFDGKFLLLAEDGKNLENRDRPIALIATGKFWVNNHAHVLQARPETNQEYLCSWLNCDRCDLTDLLTGIDQIKLTRGAMERIAVPLPPKDEQDEIVRRVESLFAFADRLEARLAQAQTAVDRLTPSLLAKAFRGELVPQDPADEPATELLARLARHAADNGGPTRLGPRRGRRPAAIQDMP